MATPTLDTIFKPEELKKARTTVYHDEIKQLRVGSRRASSPAERVALAELEERLRGICTDLHQKGLIEALPEGLAA